MNWSDARLLKRAVTRKVAIGRLGVTVRGGFKMDCVSHKTPRVATTMRASRADCRTVVEVARSDRTGP